VEARSIPIPEAKQTKQTKQTKQEMNEKHDFAVKVLKKTNEETEAQKRRFKKASNYWQK
jgi:hypothetical protein